MPANQARRNTRAANAPLVPAMDDPEAGRRARNPRAQLALGEYFYR